MLRNLCDAQERIMGQTNDEDCVTSRSLNFALLVVVFDEIGPSGMASYAMLLIESLVSRYRK
jgi:hypothetical protein